jgi:hypothetical protein
MNTKKTKKRTTGPSGPVSPRTAKLPNILI